MWTRFKNMENGPKAGLVFALGVSAYALIALSTQLYVRTFLMPQIQSASADLDRLETRIVADFKLLSEKPIYPTQTREKNAEHFLSGFISWSGADVRPLRNLEHERLAQLMHVHEHAAVKAESWQKLLNEEALEKLDLAWVDQLAAYDHIDFGSHLAHAEHLGKVASANGIDRVNLAASLPFPDMRELRFAALARIAQLQNENHLSEAPTLYRHISSLFFSSDNLAGSLMAASMLQSEKDLSERTESAWPVVDDASIQALKRATWAWVGIEHLRANTNDLGAFEPYLTRSTGACSGAFETIGYAGQLQDYFAPTAPLEFDLSERLVKADQFQRRLLELCGHEELKVFLTPVREESNPLLIQRYHPNVARIPFLRRVVGLRLIAAMFPNYFSLYEANPREPASK